MTLSELLVDRGITSALIIDDAYDDIPRAEDLNLDEAAWTTFLDDANEADRALLEGIFPAFSEMEGPELRESDTFVAAVWAAKGLVRPELWNELFDGYMHGSGADRALLDKIEQGLNALGLNVVRAGRDGPPAGNPASLILVDLFLGKAQQQEDVDRSLAVLRPLLEGRETDPPLVILMSRSGALEQRRADFRDKAGVLGALFRVSRKSEIVEGANLERAVERLAMHRPDAVKVAVFLNSWKTGLREASDRFLEGVRRLDLSDYAQLQDILLAFEGQSLGSYMLDICDRVFAHETEGHLPTIEAAEALNSVDASVYPAPHIAGSSDLQDLVYRMIWQNPRRLAVKATDADVPLALGDVLFQRSVVNQAVAKRDGWPDAFVVLSPACDLARNDGHDRRVLLLSGSVHELSTKTWSYKENEFKTPIAILENGRRVWLRWEARDYRSLLTSEIGALLGNGGAYSVCLRMREQYALELQQRLFARMGRIGLVANMPGTFPVGVSAFTLGPDQNPVALSVPKLTEEGGICYVGRDGDGNENAKLVLTEPAIDELLVAIDKLSEDQVFNKAHATLGRLKSARAFAAQLQQGLKIPSDNKFKVITAQIANDVGELVDGKIGLVARNPKDAVPPDKHNAALILIVSEDLDLIQK